MYFYYIFILLLSLIINTDLKALSFNSHNPAENPEGKDFYQNIEFAKQYNELQQKKHNIKSNDENYSHYSKPIKLYIENGAKSIDNSDSGWDNIDYIAYNNSNENNAIKNFTGKNIKNNKIKDNKNQYNSKNDLNKKKNICFVRYKEYKDIGKCLNDNLYNNHVMQSIKLKTPIKKITKKKKYHFNIQQSLAKKNINKDTNNILSKYKIDREKNTNKDGGTVTTFAKININKIEKSKLNTSCFLNYKNLKKIGKCLTYKIYYPKISHIFLSNKTIITNKMNENHINKNFYKNKDS